MFFFILYSIILSLVLYGILKFDCNLILAIYEKYCPNKDKLYGSTVLIIGASSGIGKKLAIEFINLNCKLILTATNLEKLKKVKQDLVKKGQKEENILILDFDASDFEKVDENFSKIIKNDNFKNVNILINNCGRIFVSKVTENDIVQSKKLMDINYFSHVYITKTVINYWLKNNIQGRILATSSIVTCFTNSFCFFSSYNATKLALNSFYQDLALQNLKGISVSICLPGPTSSELFSNSFEINNRKTESIPHWEMSADRCSHLMIIALANKLSISWICIQPLLLFAYINQHINFPIFYICKLLNISKLVEKQIL